MKKILAVSLIICLAFSLCACGETNYRVRDIETLESQDYSLAFRDNDPLYFYVTGALKVLAANGKIDELANKWFGANVVNFERDATALDEIGMPEPGRTLIIGVDVNSFPMVYFSNDTVFGFDIELATAVTDFLEWNLKAQSIEKENVYNELQSGNIDVAWGGIALNEKELDEGLYTQYGPYIHNDIVIASLSSSTIWNAARLRGKTLAIPSTPEAMADLETNESLMNRLGSIKRLVGGTTECFNALYSGQCDAVLTDSTAVTYYNTH